MYVRGSTNKMNNKNEVVDLNRKIVKLVKEHPELYDKSSPVYCRRENADEIWEEIAEKIGCGSAAKCKERWRNIRTAFLRDFKPDDKRQSRFPKRKYYLHEELKFLIPYVQNNYMEEFLPVSTSEENSFSSDIEQIDDNHPHTLKQVKSTSSNAILDETSISQAKNSKFNEKVSKLKRKPTDDNITEYMTSHTDPDQDFLNSLLPDIKALDARKKILFKIRVLEILHNSLEPKASSF